MRIMVGDIGGTNTTLALIRSENGRFVIQHKRRYRSNDLTGVDQAIDDFLQAVPDLKPEICCLSGAGPITDSVCSMTNVSWTINAHEVEHQLSVKTHIINDFSAICYALPLIDSHDEISAVALPHTNDATPASRGTVRAVVGAGTGLGTGYLTEDRGHFVAHPSEGGHSNFAPVDAETLGLKEYLDARSPMPPGYEQYVSGQGIANVYRYFRDTGRLSDRAACDEIDQLTEPEVAASIAEKARSSDEFAAIADLFVRMYARYASAATLFFLPTGGLYLAGGIAAKNPDWFCRNHRFMRVFENNYNMHIRPILMSIPVYVITDYDVSLYGAAHAALSL